MVLDPLSSVTLCVAGLFHLHSPASSQCYQSHSINCVWISHNLSSKCHSPSSARTLFQQHFLIVRHFSWNFSFILEALQTHHERSGLWCFIMLQIPSCSSFYQIVLKICFQKDTIGDEICSLTFFVSSERVGERRTNYSFHYVSKQKVSHFKHTLAMLRTSGEQRMKSFNVLCVQNNPFQLLLRSFCRFGFFTFQF